MPASTQPTRKGRGSAHPPQDERLGSREKRRIALGLGAAFLVAVGMGLLMDSLQQSEGTSTATQPDADADPLVIKPDYTRHLVDFSLTNQKGHAVTRRDLQGKIVVVNFVFTSCSIVCPYVNAQMEKIQAATAGDDNVRLLSLTLDPGDDMVPVLAKYAAQYHASDRWSFLTGDQAVMRNLVGTSFLPPDTTGQFSYMPGNFAHTQRIALVDGSGQVVSYFDGLNEGAGAAAVEEIGQLRKVTP